MPDDKAKIAAQNRKDKLWGGLSAAKEVSVGYDEFNKNYSTPQAQHALYTALEKEGKTKVGFSDFQERYFYDVNNPEVPAEKKKTVPTQQVVNPEKLPSNPIAGGGQESAPISEEVKNVAAPIAEVTTEVPTTTPSNKVPTVQELFAEQTAKINKDAMQQIATLQQRVQAGDIPKDKAQSLIEGIYLDKADKHQRLQDKFIRDNVPDTSNLGIAKSIFNAVSNIVAPDRTKAITDAIKSSPLTKEGQEELLPFADQLSPQELLEVNKSGIKPAHITEQIESGKLVKTKVDELWKGVEGVFSGKKPEGYIPEPMPGEEGSSIFNTIAMIIKVDTGAIPDVESEEVSMGRAEIDKKVDALDATPEQKSLIRIQLIEKLKAYPETLAIEKRTKESAAKLGIKMPEEAVAAFSKEASAISQNYNIGASKIEGNIKRGSQNIDAKFKFEQQKYTTDAKNTYTQMLAALQEQVKTGKMSEADANKQLEQKAAEIKSGADALYGQYTKSKMGLEGKFKDQLAVLDEVKDKQQSDIAAIAAKHGIEIGKEGELGFTEEYKTQIDLLQKSVEAERGYDKAKAQQRNWDGLDFAQKSLTSVAKGFIGLAETVGAGVKYFMPGNETADWGLDFLSNVRGELPQKDFSKQTLLESATDLDFLISTAGEQLPLMIPGLAAGRAAMLGARGLFGAGTALSAAGRTAIATFAGAGSSRLVEGSMEALGAYQQALKEGKNFEQAYKSAGNVFQGNMYLMLTDWLQYGVAYGIKPAKLITTSGYKKPSFMRSVPMGAGKFGIQMHTEGYEETFQEWLNAKESSPMLTFADFANSKEGNQIYNTGAIMGGMFQLMEGTGGLKDRQRMSVINNSITDYFNKYKNATVSFEDISSRHQQLQHTLATLKERGEIDVTEYNGAVKDINQSLATYAGSLGKSAQIFNEETGKYEEGTVPTPMTFNDQRFKSYHSWSVESQRLREQANKLPTNQKSQKELLNQQADVLDSRIKDLSDNPLSEVYEVDGVRLTKDEFTSLLNDPQNDALLDELAGQNKITVSDEKLSKQLSEKSTSFRTMSAQRTEKNMETMGFTPKGEAVTAEHVDNAIVQTKAELALVQQGIEQSSNRTDLINKRVDLQVQLAGLQNLQELKAPKDTTAIDQQESQEQTAAKEYAAKVSPLGNNAENLSGQEINFAENKAQRESADLKAQQANFTAAERVVKEELGEGAELTEENITKAMEKVRNRKQGELSSKTENAKTDADYKALANTLPEVKRGMNQATLKLAIDEINQTQRGFAAIKGQEKAKQVKQEKQKAESLQKGGEVAQSFVGEGKPVTETVINAAIAQQQSKLDAAKRGGKDTTGIQSDLDALKTYAEHFAKTGEQPQGIPTEEVVATPVVETTPTTETTTPAEEVASAEQKPTTESKPKNEEDAIEMPTEEVAPTTETTTPVAETTTPDNENELLQNPQQLKTTTTTTELFGNPEQLKTTPTATPKKEIVKEESDTPEGDAEDRSRGYRIVDGIKYYRQKVVNMLVGMKTKILFSKNQGGRPNGHYAIMEAADLQPSHKAGQVNNNHFLQDAQPKDRSKRDDLKKADTVKGGNLQFDELGQSPIAYFGAPVVNERGEVIQGNGRGGGIVHYYEQVEPTEKKKGKPTYKDYLKEQAPYLGMTAEEIDKFDNPVLVRVIDPTDKEAVTLGSYAADELEDTPQISAKTTSRFRRLYDAQQNALKNILTKGVNALETLNEAIRVNGKQIVEYLTGVGGVTPSEKPRYLGKNGVTPEGAFFLQQFFLQYLFEGAHASFASKFEDMPFPLRDGINRAALSLISLKEDAREILPDLQEAILLHEIYQDSGAKSWEQFLSQSVMTTEGNIAMPKDLYNISESVGKLTEMMSYVNQNKKAKLLAGWLADYYNLTLTTSGDLLHAGVKGMEYNAAIETIYQQYRQIKNENAQGNIPTKGTKTIPKRPTTSKQGSKNPPQQGQTGRRVPETSQDNKSATNTVGTQQNKGGQPEFTKPKGSEQAQTQARHATGRIAIAPIPRSAIDALIAKTGIPKLLDVFKKFRMATKVFYQGLKINPRIYWASPRMKNALGTFNKATGEVRVGDAENIDVLAHEQGHVIEAVVMKDKFLLSQADAAAKAELEKLSIYGSQPPAAEEWIGTAKESLKQKGNTSPTDADIDAEVGLLQYQYQLSEGFAEFFHAWIYNPDQAISDFPATWAFFNQAMDYHTTIANLGTSSKKTKAERMKGLEQFSYDVRLLSSLNPMEQLLAKQSASAIDKANRPFSQKAAEWGRNTAARWGMYNINGDPFYLTWMDRLNTLLFDQMTPLDKSMKMLYDMYEIDDKSLLAQTDKDIMLMARLLQGRNAKVENMTNNGLVFGKVDTLGNMGYISAIDPITGQVVNMDWLLAPLSSQTDPNWAKLSTRQAMSKLDKDRIKAGALMTAQRAIELAERNTMRWWREKAVEILMAERNTNITEAQIQDAIKDYRKKAVTARLEKDLGRVPTQSEIDAELQAVSDAASQQGIAGLQAKIDEVKAILKAPFSTTMSPEMTKEVDDRIAKAHPELRQAVVDAIIADLQNLTKDLDNPNQVTSTTDAIDQEIELATQKKEDDMLARAKARLGAGATQAELNVELSKMWARKANKARAVALEKVFGKYSKLKTIEDEVHNQTQTNLRGIDYPTPLQEKAARYKAIEIVLGRKNKNFETEIKEAMKSLGESKAASERKAAISKIKEENRKTIDTLQKKRKAAHVKALEDIKAKAEYRLEANSNLRTKAYEKLLGTKIKLTEDELDIEIKRLRHNEAANIYAEVAFNKNPSTTTTERIAQENGHTPPLPQERYDIALQTLQAQAKVGEVIDPKNLTPTQLDKMVQHIANQPIQVVSEGGIAGTSIHGKDNYINAVKLLAEFDDPQQTPVGEKAKYDEFIRRYRMWGDVTMQYAVSHGVMSQEMYEEVKKENNFYVALQRIYEGTLGEGLDEVAYWEGTHVKPATGGKLGFFKTAAAESNRSRVDPTEALMENFVKSIQFSDNNYVLNQFVDYLRGDEFGLADTKFLSDFGRKLSIIEASQGNTQNQIKLLKNGVQEIWELHPDLMIAVNALRGIAPTYSMGAKLINTIFGVPMRFIQKMITQNVVFGIRNYMRDVQQRWVQSRTAMGVPLGVFLKGMKKEVDASRNFDIYGGGQAGYDFYFKDEQKYYRAQYQAMQKMAREGKNIIPKVTDIVARTPGAMMHFLGSQTVGKLEQANRTDEYASAYKYYIKQGLSEYAAAKRAAFESRDLMDFATVGAWGKMISNFIPFFNPNVQGLKRFGQTIAEGKSNPAAIIRFFMYAGVTALPNLWATFLGKDIEDEYEELPAYQRDLFFMIKIPGYSGFMPIPKPFEVGALGSSVDRVVSAANGYEMDWNGYLGSTLRGQIPLAKEELMSLLGGWKPAFEVVTDWDSFRHKTILDGEGDLNVGMRKYHGDASNLALLLHGTIGIDARQIDHLIDGWLGFFGKMAQKTANLIPMDRDKPAAKGRVFGSEDLATSVLKEAGLYKEREPYASTTVRWVLDNAKGYGLKYNSSYKAMQDMINAYKADPTDKHYKTAISYARKLKADWEKRFEKADKIVSGEIKSLNGQSTKNMKLPEIIKIVFK